MVKSIRSFSKLKRFLIVFTLLTVAFFTYVAIANRNSKNMTYRQKVLKAIYPAWMWFTKLTGKNAEELSGSKAPTISFYTQKGILNSGDTLNFADFKGKKVLLVNTASDCGYTNQYEDLQKLADEYKDKLVVLGFPANDFKEQEKGTDTTIAEFCRVNFGVTFPLMQKSSVIKSAKQNPVFQWLTDSTKNGWNSKEPTWNFSKYLVDEKGILINYFDPSVSPSSEAVKQAIEKQ
jgi:glutathione peroxidase